MTLDPLRRAEDSMLVAPRPCSTLVVGLGNPILGDDGVGWRVAEAVRDRLHSSILGAPSLSASDRRLEVDCAALGGLSLMERLIGYDRAIVIDAIATGTRPVGSVFSCALEDLPDRSAGHTTAAHDTTLQNALEVGHRMNAHLPENIHIVGVEAELVFDFSEELSPPVAKAVPEAANRVINLATKEVVQ